MIWVNGLTLCAPTPQNGQTYVLKLFDNFVGLALDGLTARACFKDALSGLRQFLAAESLLKMMKNAFYLNLKVLFVLEIFQFLF